MAKPPTMQHVADRAGVSRALVSLVMRNSPRVSESSRAVVLQAAEELGYRPNLIARHLASNASFTLGVVIDDLHNPFFHDAVDGVEHAAVAHGYNVLIRSGHRDPDRERQSIDGLIDFRVDALVLLGPRLGHELIDAAGRRLPTAVVGRPSSSRIVDSVNNDEIDGTRLAVQHLTDLGHRTIVHVSGGLGAGARPRRAGYELAMDAAGLHSTIIDGEFTEASGFEAAEQLIRSGALPTAVIAANDACALGILDRFSREGVRVPDDVSVVGYDDTSPAALGYVSLTTISQPCFDMGVLAVETLLKRLDNPSAETVHHVLRPTLTIRRTTAPPRSTTPPTNEVSSA